MPPRKDGGAEVIEVTIKTYIRSILLGALATLSLAGFMIHARTLNWWILHIAAVTFFFWLGHAIHF